MMETATRALEISVGLGFALLLAGMVLTSVRLVRGPSRADRVVALDMIAFLMVAFAALFSLASGVGAFLDVAISLALVAFLGTVALARYTERRNHRAEAAPEEAGS